MIFKRSHSDNTLLAAIRHDLRGKTFVASDLKKISSLTRAFTLSVTRVRGIFAAGKAPWHFEVIYKSFTRSTILKLVALNGCTMRFSHEVITRIQRAASSASVFNFA